MATVLIVDDEPNNRSLLDVLLTHAGHDVIQAANGAEALSALARGTPDLIILDLSLPDISGAELLRRLRSASATVDCPIALYTATQAGPAIDELIDAFGIRAILPKPGNPEDMLKCFERLIPSG